MDCTKKTDIFVNTLHTLRVRVLNTFVDLTVYNWTCAYTTREAGQDALMATDFTIAHRAIVQILDSAATSSELRAL